MHCCCCLWLQDSVRHVPGLEEHDVERVHVDEDVLLRLVADCACRAQSGSVLRNTLVLGTGSSGRALTCKVLAHDAVVGALRLGFKVLLVELGLHVRSDVLGAAVLLHGLHQAGVGAASRCSSAASQPEQTRACMQISTALFSRVDERWLSMTWHEWRPAMSSTTSGAAAGSAMPPYACACSGTGQKTECRLKLHSSRVRHR